MSDRQSQLAARRSSLQARSDVLRARMAADGESLRHSVEAIDRGIGFVRSLISRPLLLIGAAAAAVFVFRPGRAFKWVARAALVTSILRRVVKTLDRPQPPDRLGE